MIPNARENQFDFRFPRKFFPEEVIQKYRGYLNRIPGNIIQEPVDFINYSVQSVNFPGMGFEPVVQPRKPGRNLLFRDTIPTQELFEKEFTVTFQLLDGYINYWILLDTLNACYSFDEPDPYIQDLAMRTLDSEGNALVTIKFLRPLFKNISALDFSFGSNVGEFKTFDIQIAYNELQVEIELD